MVEVVTPQKQGRATRGDGSNTRKFRVSTCCRNDTSFDTDGKMFLSQSVLVD